MSTILDLQYILLKIISARNRIKDLHVLEKAISSAHPNQEEIFASFIESYKSTMAENLPEKKKNEVQKIMDKLENVRMRGRKRSMVG